MEDPKLKEESLSQDISELLIELALGKQEDQEDPFVMQIRNFIRAAGIKAGKKSIPLNRIYEFYSRHIDYPMGKNKFAKIFRLFFTLAKPGGVICFKLNPLTIGLPAYYTLIADMRQRKIHGKKKKTRTYYFKKR